MLCGASDLDEVLPFFKQTASEMGFKPLNFLSGEIYYHQYGEDNWKSNSILTVESANIIIFVINNNYGDITWKNELPKTLESGKNFLILCKKETYSLYLQVKSGKVKAADEKTSKLISQIEEMENGFQITIIPYDGLIDFNQKLKSNINGIYKNAINALEVKNQRATILPLLKLGSINKALHSSLHVKVAKEILFDVFEQKELRIRALDFLTELSVFSDDEIVLLFIDVESGIARKSVVNLPKIINDSNNVEYIFSELISCCTENEVGFLRRAIRAVFHIDLNLAIKYLPNLFPAQDIGTPRRIITFIDERMDDVLDSCRKNRELLSSTKKLIRLCIEFRTDEKDWKDRAKHMINLLEHK